jgi:hypothetical protein
LVTPFPSSKDKPMITKEEPYKEIFPVEEIKDWENLIAFYQRKQKEWKDWIFRGQEDSKWGLTTTFERNMERLNIRGEDHYELERGLLRKFQRHFHVYSNYLPSDDIEWLSFMQHFGTATRLLDCTYSFYVALFFALESARFSEEKYSTVWAFDTDWLGRRCRALLPKKERNKINEFEFGITNPIVDKHLLFRKKPIPFVYPVTPLKRNERITIQQGGFLAPGDLKKSFIENLESMAERKELRKHLYLILLPRTEEFLHTAILELHRMNMNSATLFRGLDGFARHLNNLVVSPQLIAADNTDFSELQQETSNSQLQKEIAKLSERVKQVEIRLDSLDKRVAGLKKVK